MRRAPVALPMRTIDGLTPVGHAPQVRQSAVHAREGGHDISTTFVAEHNMLLRRSRLTSSIHSGRDRAYKAVAALDSLSVSLKALNP